MSHDAAGWDGLLLGEAGWPAEARADELLMAPGADATNATEIEARAVSHDPAGWDGLSLGGAGWLAEARADELLMAPGARRDKCDRNRVRRRVA